MGAERALGMESIVFILPAAILMSSSMAFLGKSFFSFGIGLDVVSQTKPLPMQVTSLMRAVVPILFQG